MTGANRITQDMLNALEDSTTHNNKPVADSTGRCGVCREITYGRHFCGHCRKVVLSELYRALGGVHQTT